MEKERHNFDIRGMKGIVVLNFHLLGHVINSVLTKDNVCLTLQILEHQNDNF